MIGVLKGGMAPCPHGSATGYTYVCIVFLCVIMLLVLEVNDDSYIK